MSSKPKPKLAKKTNELVDLFAQVTIGDYTVKPWTITQFISLAPVLKQVIKSLEEQGIDFSQADLQNISLAGNLTAKDVATYLSMGMEVVGPAIPYLISVSARIDLEEASNIDWGVALALTAQIIALNWEHIKNWLGQTQLSKMMGLAEMETN